MRRVLLILMIALLPVRGWAADMMAISMAEQQLHVWQSIQAGNDGQTASAQPAVQVQSAMSADCPMMAMLAGQPVSDESGQAGSPILKMCTTCQLCMALAADQSVELTLPSFVSHAPPVSRAVEFSGVTVASVFKPPIS